MFLLQSKETIIITLKTIAITTITKTIQMTYSKTDLEIIIHLQETIMSRKILTFGMLHLSNHLLLVKSSQSSPCKIKQNKTIHSSPTNRQLKERITLSHGSKMQKPQTNHLSRVKDRQDLNL